MTNPSTPAPAAYPDPQDPGRTTIYEPSAQSAESAQSTKTDRGALDPSESGPTTPSERMADEFFEEE